MVFIWGGRETSLHLWRLPSINSPVRNHPIVRSQESNFIPFTAFHLLLALFFVLIGYLHSPKVNEKRNGLIWGDFKILIFTQRPPITKSPGCRIIRDERRGWEFSFIRFCGSLSSVYGKIVLMYGFAAEALSKMTNGLHLRRPWNITSPLALPSINSPVRNHPIGHSQESNFIPFTAFYLRLAPSTVLNGYLHSRK